MDSMYYISLDVHKKTISYCVKDGSGQIHAEGAIPTTRFDLNRWMKTQRSRGWQRWKLPYSRDGFTTICIPTPRQQEPPADDSLSNLSANANTERTAPGGFLFWPQPRTKCGLVLGRGFTQECLCHRTDAASTFILSFRPQEVDRGAGRRGRPRRHPGDGVVLRPAALRLPLTAGSA